MFCKNCGTKFEDGNKFCPSCGTAVIAEESSVAAAAVTDFETKTVKKPAIVAVVFAIVSIVMYLMPWISVPSGTAFGEGWFFLFNMHGLIETMPYADSVMVSFIIALCASCLLSLSAVALYVWYIIGEFRHKNNPLTLRLASMISMIMTFVTIGVVISMGVVNEGDIVSYFKEYANGIVDIFENQAMISVTVIVLFLLSVINMFIASTGKMKEITVAKTYADAPVTPVAPVYNQPTQTSVYEQPAAQPVFEQPAAQSVFEQPAAQPVFEQPAAQPVYEQPVEEPAEAVVPEVTSQEAEPKVQNLSNSNQNFSTGGDL